VPTAVKGAAAAAGVVEFLPEYMVAVVCRCAAQQVAPLLASAFFFVYVKASLSPCSHNGPPG